MLSLIMPLPIWNAIEILHKKHNIYFVTAGNPETIPWRHQWLKVHFTWYDRSNVKNDSPVLEK
jgi:5'(3')-deoxyribonucleotidase